MGWMYDLYQTYENNIGQVGKVGITKSNRRYTLLPIAHTTQSAQVEITVDEAGNFYNAKVVDKEEATTVIPCTEQSLSRTSKPVPHPLHDKLMYVAGDFEKYGGKIRKGFQPYEDYLTNLKEWVESPHTNDRVKSIYWYILKGTLIKDLIEVSILSVDKKNHLIPKWTKTVGEEYGEKPKLFKVISDTQDKVFVRFNTHKLGSSETKVWEDEEVINSFINFYKDKLQQSDLCYVTGKTKPRTEKHLSGLRRAGDSAKLISGNDTSGLTFRGRFDKANEVVSISYDVSQKAHNALKWLIQKQGKIVDGRVFLVWGNEKTEVPSPQDDADSLFRELGYNFTNETEESDTHEIFAEKFSKAIDGYKSDLSYKSQVSILILDAATPGRLSIVYYRNLEKEEYLKQIIKWHQTCSWLHQYKKSEGKQRIKFYGAPSSRDIALVAYGPRVGDNIIKGTMERILPCIVDGHKIPLDIIRSAFYRASNPVAMDRWEWEKTLSITCALLNKQYEKEGYEVALDVTNRNRDYLFGRLLAVADVLERRALTKEEDRATNAIRYMNAFSRHPARTWQIIQTNLQPYQVKLGNKAFYYNRLIDEIASQIEIDDFNNKPLSGKYLLGFYSQRYELYTSKKEKQENYNSNQEV
ncbi:type I-C CRISPR-associated protein Cas8c/Csd1 [Natranaerobius trueperi]|uniref:Type I-C CRISPR-associated protein Cas8c/Csd1 n=1 Tax=Natranaerobius trueperi TaxID=759412 RepID=A0A226BY57_9FIRM|nr:type I-C CRISPR-associated protein Cas8c/Csd1 [Natranaerobius trueperi]OWZ83865.1 type I-C CRISPR-associated protein Cas8c/Csd1 [Natranaerobius trueperi]